MAGELEWGREGYEQVAELLAVEPVDWVLAADCCYVDQVLPGMVSRVVVLCAWVPPAEIIPAWGCSSPPEPVLIRSFSAVNLSLLSGWNTPHAPPCH